MAGRRFGLIVCALCLCLSLAQIPALAASTADAKESIATDRECTLTLSYRHQTMAFPNVAVKLYRVAEVSADFQYTLTPQFAASDLMLNGIQSSSEWRVVRSTLESYILANSVAPDMTALTDEDGHVQFQGLKTGLYFLKV